MKLFGSEDSDRPARNGQGNFHPRLLCANLGLPGFRSIWGMFRKGILRGCHETFGSEGDRKSQSQR